MLTLASRKMGRCVVSANFRLELLVTTSLLRSTFQNVVFVLSDSANNLRHHYPMRSIILSFVEILVKTVGDSMLGEM
jgi:hypothetical protein